MGWPPSFLRRVLSPYYCWRLRQGKFCWCLRVNVKRNGWQKPDPADKKAIVRRDASNQQDLELAMRDLELKPKDMGGLSLYAVRSSKEAEEIALLHQVTNGKPNASYYLRVPIKCVTALPSPACVVHEPIKGQHPTLKRHHYSVYGLTDENVRKEFVRSILASEYVFPVGWTEPQIRKAAAAIKDKPDVREFMRFKDSW